MLAVLRSGMHAPQQPVPRGPRVRRWLGHLFREWTIESWRPIAPASAKPEPSKWSNTHLTLAWLGHSTVLINFFGVTILTDPVLFPRIGIRLPGFTIGPKRLTASARCGDHGFTDIRVRRVTIIIAGIEAAGMTRLCKQLLGLALIVNGRRRLPVEIVACRNDAVGEFGVAKGQRLIDRLAVER